MLKRLTIKDKHKKTAWGGQGAVASTILDNLPKVGEKDLRSRRKKKPKSRTPDYINANLGPYLADELDKMAGKQYSDRMRESIIEFTLAKVAGGTTIAQLSNEEGRCFPSKEVLYNWIMRNEELAKEYTLATEMGIEAKVDSLGHEVETSPDIERVKLKVKFVQWLAAKKMPKQYGESKHLVVDQRSINMNLNRIDGDMSPEDASRIYADSFTVSEED